MHILQHNNSYTSVSYSLTRPAHFIISTRVKSSAKTHQIHSSLPSFFGHIILAISEIKTKILDTPCKSQASSTTTRANTMTSDHEINRNERTMGVRFAHVEIFYLEPNDYSCCKFGNFCLPSCKRTTIIDLDDYEEGLTMKKYRDHLDIMSSCTSTKSSKSKHHRLNGSANPQSGQQEDEEEVKRLPLPCHKDLEDNEETKEDEDNRNDGQEEASRQHEQRFMEILNFIERLNDQVQQVAQRYAEVPTSAAAAAAARRRRVAAQRREEDGDVLASPTAPRSKRAMPNSPTPPTPPRRKRSIVVDKKRVKLTRSM